MRSSILAYPLWIFCFCRAFTADDEYLKAHLVYNEGVHCSVARDVACALEKYATALLMKHDFPEAHQNYALLLEDIDTNEAMKHHSFSVDFSATTQFKASAMTNLALVQLRIIPNKSKATAQSGISLLLDAMALDPGNSNIAFTLGLTFADVGDFESALMYFRETLLVDGNHSMALMNIGNHYMRLYNFVEAVSYYERAIAAAGEDNPLEKVSTVLYSNHVISYHIRFYRNWLNKSIPYYHTLP